MFLAIFFREKKGNFAKKKYQNQCRLLTKNFIPKFKAAQKSKLLHQQHVFYLQAVVPKYYCYFLFSLSARFPK